MALPMATQSELVAELAEATGFPKGEVKHLLTALEDFIAEEIANGNRVRFCGVQVEPRVKKAVKFKKLGARNPQTGEQVDRKAKPAQVVVKAKMVGRFAPKKVKVPSVKKLQGKF